MVTIHWKRVLVYTKACLCEVCLILNDLVKNSNLKNSKKLRRTSLVFQENTIIVVGKEDVQDPITPLKDTTITRVSLSTFLS